MDFPLPVLGVTGPSGCGKTTLLCALIGRLTHSGLRIAAVKQASDRFDVDYPGKDSHALRHAGVGRVLLAGGRRSALIGEQPDGAGPELAEQLARLDASVLDLVLVEGFSDAPIARIAVCRGPAGEHVRHPGVLAVVSDEPLAVPCARFVRTDVEAIADFVLAWRMRWKQDRTDGEE